MKRMRGFFLSHLRAGLSVSYSSNFAFFKNFPLIYNYFIEEVSVGRYLAVQGVNLSY